MGKTVRTSFNPVIIAAVFGKFASSTTPDSTFPFRRRERHPKKKIPNIEAYPKVDAVPMSFRPVFGMMPAHALEVIAFYRTQPDADIEMIETSNA